MQHLVLVRECPPSVPRTRIAYGYAARSRTCRNLQPLLETQQFSNASPDPGDDTRVIQQEFLFLRVYNTLDRRIVAQLAKLGRAHGTQQQQNPMPGT